MHGAASRKSRPARRSRRRTARRRRRRRRRAGLPRTPWTRAAGGGLACPCGSRPAVHVSISLFPARLGRDFFALAGRERLVFRPLLAQLVAPRRRRLDDLLVGLARL